MKSTIFKNNHSHQKSRPALSETFSSDVPHFVWDSPTDTPPALNEAFAKVENISQSAKNNIRKFVNNDLKIDFNGTFDQIRVNLRKILVLKKAGISDYTVYLTPKGRLAFRIANHNANGNNFSKNESDINISIYVAYQEYIVPPSLIPYREYRFEVGTFENKKEECIRAIINAVKEVIETGDFNLPDNLASMISYPNESESEQQNENLQYNKMRNNSTKSLYESIMKDVAKVVKRQLNEAVANEYPTYGKRLAIDPEIFDDLLRRMRRLQKENYFTAEVGRIILSEISAACTIPQLMR